VTQLDDGLLLLRVAEPLVRRLSRLLAEGAPLLQTDLLRREHLLLLLPYSRFLLAIGEVGSLMTTLFGFFNFIRLPRVEEHRGIEAAVPQALGEEDTAPLLVLLPTVGQHVNRLPDGDSELRGRNPRNGVHFLLLLIHESRDALLLLLLPALGFPVQLLEPLKLF